MALSPHFNLAEAQALIALCAHVNDVTTGDPPPKEPPEVIPIGTPIIPDNWQQVFKPDSSIPPFDGYYEIWKNTDVDQGTTQLAVVFRGTQPDAASILEDLLLFMVPAKATIQLPEVGSTTYTFAEQAGAGIHVGFLLGLVTLLVDVSDNNLLINLGEQACDGDNEIFITGHSQGAALGTLFTSFVKYHPDLVPVLNASYKTYVYGQPKPGNDYYAYDFEHLVANDGFGFRVINPLGWVSQAPFTLQQPNDWAQPNPFTVIEARYPEVAKILDDIVNSEKALVGSLADLANDAIKELLGTDPGLQILPTLNFTGAGIPYILTNQPDIPPRNPCDRPSAAPPVIDFFWQHHASMYAKLLGVKAGPIPPCRPPSEG